MTMHDKTKIQKRSVGRPKGSTEQVEDELMTEGIALHYFAYLRALAEGLPYLKTAHHYLPHDRIGPEKARQIHKEQLARCVRLLRHYREVANSAPQWLNAPAKAIEESVTLGLPVGDAVTDAVTRVVLKQERQRLLEKNRSKMDTTGDAFQREILDISPVETESPDLVSQMLKAVANELPEPPDVEASIEDRPYMPDIEEFAAKFPPDFYSEETLTELYCEEFKVDRSLSNAREAHIRALNWLMCRVSVIPVPTDPIGIWFSKRLADQLKYCGVLSLGDAITFINMSGRLWHRKVRGLGRERANRFVRWLARHEPQIKIAISHHIKDSLNEVDDDELLSVQNMKPNNEIAIKERSDAPGIFEGYTILDAKGKFRAPGVSTIDARNDYEAVERWLRVISLKSQNTLDAYSREIERLMIWVRREKHKTLSDITLDDALEFREMLLNPPAHWVNPLSVSRASPDWRPLRGPLSGASLNRSIAAISSLYKFLVQQNYLVANPFSAIPGKRDTNRMDVFRSFGPRDQEAIGATLDDLEPTLFTRRLKVILKVLLNTGLRRDELASAKWSQIRTNRMNEETEHLLHIVGKGEKPRIIPLRPDVYQELIDHKADYYSLVASGDMPPPPDKHDDPLIFSLKKFGDQENQGAQLSDDGIYSTLKTFFQKVASRFSGDDYANFELASTHWMRHTFAHEVLKATGNDLSVVQGLMGHSSIATTGIYLQANQAEQSAAVNKIPSRF